MARVCAAASLSFLYLRNERSSLVPPCNPLVILTWKKEENTGDRKIMSERRAEKERKRTGNEGETRMLEGRGRRTQPQPRGVRRARFAQRAPAKTVRVVFLLSPTSDKFYASGKLTVGTGGALYLNARSDKRHAEFFPLVPRSYFYSRTCRETRRTTFSFRSAELTRNRLYFSAFRITTIPYYYLSN